MDFSSAAELQVSSTEYYIVTLSLVLYQLN